MGRQRYQEKVHSAKLRAPMSGGRSRYSFFWDCRRLSSILRGPLFRERIIFLVIISHLFIPLKFSVIRHIAVSAESLFGGRAGFGSPVITTAARTTKPFGPTHPRALSESRVKATGANVRFRSSCKTFIGISFISH